MKNEIFKTKLFLMALGATLLFSCSAEDGEDGAIGPQGIPGEQGPEGPQGQQGEEGTANVMYSDWLDQDFSWIDGDTYKGMLVDEIRLTNDFFNEGGIVLGFFRFQDNVQYNLPYEPFNRETRRDMTAISFADRGEVRFGLESTDGSVLTDNEVNGIGPSIQAQFKYVMIPGGVNLTGRSERPNFQKMTYHELMDYFGLTH